MTDKQLNLSEINAQELLEQILAAGKDLVKQGQAQTGDLTVKGKELASKGEDYLVDKLNIEDTDVSREALRKGVGAGAAAGAVALLLSSRSGRKMATLGGLGALGILAYKAHKAGKMPTNAEDVIGLLKGPQANERAATLLKAMVSAAKADGSLHEDELDIINAYEGASVDAVQAVMDQPTNARAIAALADSDQAAAEIYAVSCRVANGLNPKERDYLDELAMGLKLDPELAAKIETEMRTG
ncbi:DUF533 domain-containing protein [Hellea balneolensis]|uniref:DUF533 domain-containing protein n=1 Tax=Hellea balneolensis TaxID=287478 RepID=UPI0003FA3C94|nr:DUF533 domain-containing protein [Hellea balneolensis]